MVGATLAVALATLHLYMRAAHPLYGGDPRGRPGYYPPPFVPTTNGYVGLTQIAQPLPTTPPLVPGGQAEQETGARKSLRRYGLRATGAEPALPQEPSGELSADMQVLSDPYLRAMIQRYSQKGQTIKQSPGEAP